MIVLPDAVVTYICMVVFCVILVGIAYLFVELISGGFDDWF